MKENRRYNRRERGRVHIYDRDFGTKGLGIATYGGYFKCKLVHTRGGSVIVPDQVLVETDGGGLLWIQPLAFVANSITKTPEGIDCTIFLDISLGNTLEIRWKASGYIRSYADGSQLFRCEIRGPKGLPSYATGRAEMDADSRVFIELYHHTTPGSRKLIESSGHLRGSPWNIQGNRTLQNVAYGYLTPLNRISNDQDLREIAMAGDETIYLRPDNVDAPEPVDPEWIRRNPGRVLELKVYRERTSNRRASLRFSVDASILAPQHVLRHDPHGEPVYYEVNQPFIHRIGVNLGGGIRFNSKGVMGEQPDLKRFEYLVLGDATTTAGLTAPYDEENTRDIFKIEMLPDGSDMLTFWMDKANQDLYSGREVERQRHNPVVAST